MSSTVQAPGIKRSDRGMASVSAGRYTAFFVGPTGRGRAEARAAAYARASSGGAAAGHEVPRRHQRIPATEPTAATATLTSAIG